MASARRVADAIRTALPRGERVRIRVKSGHGQPFESYWHTLHEAMAPSELAMQMAQTLQPGMLLEIDSGRTKCTYLVGANAGRLTVTRVRTKGK